MIYFVLVYEIISRFPKCDIESFHMQFISVKNMYRVPVAPLSNIISLAVKYLKGDPILNSKVLKNV